MRTKTTIERDLAEVAALRAALDEATAELLSAREKRFVRHLGGRPVGGAVDEAFQSLYRLRDLLDPVGSSLKRELRRVEDELAKLTS